MLQLILTLITAGCLTPLDRFAEYSGGQVVIAGQISPLQETSVVYVGRTADRERLPEPVYDATVSVFDDAGNAGVYTEAGGRFILENFPVVPGRTYYLRVILPEGKVYESVPEKMPALLGKDEVYYSIEPEEYTDQDGIVSERRFVQIYTNHTCAAGSALQYTKWNVQEVYMIAPTDFPDPFNNVPPSCYVAQEVDPQKINLFSTEDVKATHIPNLHLVSRLIDPSFKERHYFTVYQSSLTREAYEYWRKVDILANQVGSIFDSPPARLTGNVSNVDNRNEEVFGYFQAANETLTRFYLLPDDLPFRMPYHCEYRPERNYLDYPPECLNCIAVRNSSYDRPPWF